MNALQVLETIHREKSKPGTIYPFDGTWEEMNQAIKEWNLIIN